MMVRIKLSSAQQSALECRDGGGLDPLVDAAWDRAGALVFNPVDADELWSELNEASNAEDAQRQTGDALAGRAARSLAALGGRVLRCAQ